MSIESQEMLTRAVGAFLAPFFWVFVFAVPLWLCRRFFPKAEFWLFRANVRWLIGYCAGRCLRAVRQALAGHVPPAPRQR
jgi:hypothetical protein